MSSLPVELLGFAEAEICGRQVQAFEQRHDVDAAGFEYRAVGEVDLVQLGAGASFSDTLCAGPGRKLARTRHAFSPSLRSRLAGWTWSESSGRGDTSAPDWNSARIS